MNTRGIYSASVINVSGCGHGTASSTGIWVVGSLLVGGALLWANHQSHQIDRLYAAVGLPQQSFVEDLSRQSKELTSAVRAKMRVISQSRHGIQKEL